MSNVRALFMVGVTLYMIRERKYHLLLFTAKSVDFFFHQELEKIL